MRKMMIARRRMIESLSKIAQWIYKAGNGDFFEGSLAGYNYGLSFSPTGAKRLRLAPTTLKWVTIYVPSGEQVPEEKDIGGYVNVGAVREGSNKPVAYDFSPFKQLVIEVESGTGVFGYGAQQPEISEKLDGTHIIDPAIKIEITGAGKYVMDISKVNTSNFVTVGSNQFVYGAPRLVVSNIYFK